MGSNNLTITILPEDFKNAPAGYGNRAPDQGCVLWQALKRLNLGENIGVSTTWADVDEIRYKLPEEWGAVHGKYSVMNINQWSYAAKESLEGIPEVTLTLTPLIS